MLADRHGRVARYLRVSVTDRCNLGCVYCRRPESARLLSHGDILRYEEMLRLLDVAVAHGIRKVRVTGGEPFVRKGCDEFLSMLRARFPDLALAVTSNGTLLEPHVPLLRRLNVASVNLSLDSFDRATFARVTGRDLLPSVLASLERLLAAGVPVKLNAVALRGVNDGQLDDFIHAARTMPLDVRFIEYMPLGEGSADDALFWPMADVRQAVSSRVALAPAQEGAPLAGPARMFDLAGGRGRIGFIAAVADHACRACGRLRLTADGALLPCLFSPREYRLRGLVRHPRLSDEALGRVLRRVCEMRPLGERIRGEKARVPVPASGCRRKIGGIGG